MVKIESLKNYIGVLNEDEFIKLSKQIYDITDFICEAQRMVFSQTNS